MDSGKAEKDIVVWENHVDLAGFSRNALLVKMPKSISSLWEKCPKDITAGRLTIREYNI